MGKLKHTLKAATLMESLVAMTIIVVCLGVGTMIYSNVLDSDKQRLKFKAILLLNKVSDEIKQSRNFLNGEIQSGDFLIKKIVEKVPGTESVHSMTLVLSDKEGRVLGNRKELIIE